MGSQGPSFTKATHGISVKRILPSRRGGSEDIRPREGKVCVLFHGGFGNMNVLKSSTGVKV